MSFYKKLKPHGCAIIAALFLALISTFILAMLIGVNRQYQEEACFDRNLTGKPMPRHEMNELAEQCTKNPAYRKTHSN